MSKFFFSATLLSILSVFLSSCATTTENRPQARVSTASPEVLRKVMYADPQNAYRYVNPGNANMVFYPAENYRVLHAAAFEQNFPLIRALVENGADPNCKARFPYRNGNFGPYVRTPATVALMWGRRDIAQYLAEQSGEDFAAIDSVARDNDNAAKADLRRAEAVFVGAAAAAWVNGSHEQTSSSGSDRDADASNMIQKNQEAQSAGNLKPFPEM